MSSLDKIFYKIVYHYIIYMCDFFINLDDFFYHDLHGFSRRLWFTPDTFPTSVARCTVFSVFPGDQASHFFLCLPLAFSLSISSSHSTGQLALASSMPSSEPSLSGSQLADSVP